MDVNILKVYNHGDASEEYVLLEVTNDCDIGDYTISDSTYTSDGKVSNKLRHIYWFPDKLVKKGDRVSLRTGVGTNTEENKNGGGKIHRFYWNLKSSVWNDDGDAAILMKVADWSHKGASNKN